MKKPIIIQGALQSEIDFLLEKFTVLEKILIGGYVFYECMYKEYPVILSKTKIGEISSAAATALAVQKYDPVFIINQGTAGAFKESLNTGDIIVGTEICYISQFSTAGNKETDVINPWKDSEYKTIDGETVSLKTDEKFLKWLCGLKILRKDNIYFDKIASGDVWSRDINIIKHYHEKYGAVCEAMECTGAYMAANSFRCPVVSIRVISNNELTKQEYDEKTAIISQNTAINIIEEFIKEQKTV